jgi:hypothetical protein
MKQCLQHRDQQHIQQERRGQVEHEESTVVESRPFFPLQSGGSLGCMHAQAAFRCTTMPLLPLRAEQRGCISMSPAIKRRGLHACISGWLYTRSRLLVDRSSDHLYLLVVV